MRAPSDTFEVGRLKRRADFLRAAKGKRWHGKVMTVQAAPSRDDGEPARIGFTLTRKVGGAVIRNRARRRLKEAVRLAMDLPVEAGRDYVIIGRIDAIHLPFKRLQDDLAGAFTSVHQKHAKVRAIRPAKRTEPE